MYCLTNSTVPLRALYVPAMMNGPTGSSPCPRTRPGSIQQIDKSIQVNQYHPKEPLLDNQLRKRSAAATYLCPWRKNQKPLHPACRAARTYMELTQGATFAQYPPSTRSRVGNFMER
eukprot:TRINITY_DN10141_c0_g2_i1.p2 TRINITY_DN10141_c0_g2~~TRINITY_DN10141_c0_g2_i1.p2  ORF type:complete len:117 (+),score=13.90 TRINITY_DN10141_c0_g2_i1:162-512(+)